jgi:hypothetical protein
MRVPFPIRQMLCVISQSISKNIERLSYAQRLRTRKLASVFSFRFLGETLTLSYRLIPYPRISTPLDSSYQTRTTCSTYSTLIMVFWSLEKVLEYWGPMNMAKRSWLWQNICG